MNTETKPCEIQVTPGKMDPSWKAAWINALRSGEFKETHMTWRNPWADDCGCAVGALSWALGQTSRMASDKGVGGDINNMMLNFKNPIGEEILNKSGLTVDQLTQVSNIFEGSYRESIPAKDFAYMANWIEENL